MKIEVEIHESWLNDDAFHYWIARAARLSKPRPADAAHEDRRDAGEGNPPDPSDGRGDAWEPPAGGPQPRQQHHQEQHHQEQHQEQESPPADGRQLLGWASKQVPDAKGPLLSYAKKRGLPSKIVTWSPDQVNSAYRFLRARQAP